MKLSPVQASLLALALFAAAPTARADQPVLLAQAEQGGASQNFGEVRKFLANNKDITRLDEARLQQRLIRAQRLRETPDLPPELDQALQQEIVQLQDEVNRRAEANAPAPQPEKQRTEPPQIENPPLPPALGDAAPGDQPQPDQPPQKRKHRKQQAQDQQPDAQPPQDQQAETPQPAPGADGSPVVAQFLQSVRPASELDRNQLRQQMERAMELSKGGHLPPAQRNALRDVIREARAALRQPESQPAPETPPVTAGQPKVEQPKAGQPPKQAGQPPASVDPKLEAQAQAILADNVDVRTLNRKQMKRRLASIRDLLASDQLSPATSEALRQKLAHDRQVLRNEVAVDEGLPPPLPQGQQSGQTPQGQQTGKPPRLPEQQGGGNSNVVINNNTTVNNTNTDVRVVLRDRRPPDQLDDRELVRRIDVYRDVVADDRYAEDERMMWRQQMENDRRFLRQRMIAERRQREARLRGGDVQFNFDVEDRYDPRREVPEDVFAAEAEDDEIADVLSAPPRRQIQRRYTLDEIERSPDARDAVARIEIDTVHFGFGEGYLREEEIDKLDRIATVLEKILARHPDEVFLIEGHTDAVGSDAANLVLSRQRAAAVKQALVTYYVIPPDNLKTVGLGERYLKIPTDQPEAENRRVSLARITPLVGQAD